MRMFLLSKLCELNSTEVRHGYPVTDQQLSLHATNATPSLPQNVIPLGKLVPTLPYVQRPRQSYQKDYI